MDKYPSLLISIIAVTNFILLDLNTVYVPNSKSLLTINSYSILQNVGFDILNIYNTGLQLHVNCLHTPLDH